jgi:hypothetical protein
VPDQSRGMFDLRKLAFENRLHRLEVETARELEAPARYKSAFMVTVPSFSSTALNP